ncbi:polymer-forming cytoskeletal protein [Aquidulcibacter sp.]|uniref:bactofilin family protein n=1 Tax=Aquidulcibacter sp. TaxID=2052990 RepID=UPI0025BE7676|nr:polymer-forming cytoskeletal protein [Aquidulcibacter sp.]MCA3696201.1 polymer-forming cytoskeletal protein [Aquidulcibacter sp.]
MAFWNAKSKESYVETETVAVPAPRNDPPAIAVVAPSPKPAASVVAAGAVVSGSLSSPGDVHIEGIVIGDVRCDTLVVGKNGEVKGNVISEIATIRGRVSGDVRARMIQLATSGSIDGDLTHAILIIEEGGQFEGRSKRSADPLAGPSIETTHIEEKATAERPAKRAKAPAAKAQTSAAAEAKSPVANEEASRSSLADALGDAFAVNA